MTSPLPPDPTDLKSSTDQNPHEPPTVAGDSDLANSAAQFRHQFLWPDEEWLAVGDEDFVYWPARSAQHFRLSLEDDGSTWWRWSMHLVEDVTRADVAHWLCIRLNEYACGWSLNYDPGKRNIVARSALLVPVGFDRFLLRFAEGAKLAGWFCEAILDSMAEATGGSAVISHPENQEAPRVVPDAVGYLPTARRERPEWVYDWTPNLFPKLEQLALRMALKIGATYEDTIVGEQGFSICRRFDNSTLDYDVTAVFDIHPLLGRAWRTDVRLSAGSDPALHPDAINSATAYTFESGNLIGTWLSDGESLVYRTWALTSELHSYEQLPTAAGYSDSYLGGITTQSSNASYWHQQPDHQQEWASFADVPEPQDLGHWIDQMLLALGSQHHWQLDAPVLGDTRARREYLWWPHKQTLLLLGWFNPSGPTWATLEVLTNPRTGRNHLFHIRRHPYLPKYMDAGTYATDEEWRSALADGIDLMCQGVIPNVVMPFDGFDDEVRSALRAAMDSHVAHGGMDQSYADTTRKIRGTMGEPWAYAGNPRSARYDSVIAELPPVTEDAGFETWFEMASHPLNLAANLSQVSSAWDGAINFQRSAADSWHRSQWDIGPYTLIYDNEIGNLPPEVTGRPTES